MIDKRPDFWRGKATFRTDLTDQEWAEICKTYNEYRKINWSAKAEGKGFKNPSLKRTPQVAVEELCKILEKQGVRHAVTLEGGKTIVWWNPRWER